MGQLAGVWLTYSGVAHYKLPRDASRLRNDEPRQAF